MELGPPALGARSFTHWTTREIPVYSFLCMTSFIKYNVFKVHVCCNRYQYFIPFRGWIVYLLYGYTTFCLSIHQLIDSWVVSTFLAIMDSPTKNIYVPVFVQTYDLISLGYILRNGNSGSYSNSLFNHFRNCWTVFQSSCTILRSHQ